MQRNFEREVLAHIEAALFERPDIRVIRGQGANNRFDIPGWDLPLHQRFQYGDLRIESPSCTVVVEAESAGGVTNLVKYWPCLRSSGQGKRFVIVHLFCLKSKGDYSAYRRLWEFLADRMAEDLKARCGLERPRDWDARPFTYLQGARPDEAIEFIRSAIEASD